MNTEQDIIDTYGEDWEQKADALRSIPAIHEVVYDGKFLNDFLGKYLPMLEDSELAESYKRFREANKPKVECKKCDKGERHDMDKFDMGVCSCCIGNWRDCPNCAETEYRKSQLPANTTASAEWLKRNTHASPQEKAQAKKNGEALNKGIDWSKVPEVIQPSEINWNRFIEGNDWDE